MKLTITSASGTVLQADAFVRITLMTESGEITVLDHHEPLISAVRPGLLVAEYYVGSKVHTLESVTGGGVVNITPDACTVIADVVQNADSLTDLEYIESQKKEAEALMKAYREENGPAVDPKRLLEIEYELLRYTAMHRLGEKYHTADGSRK